jgi:hypothetical protein
VTLGNGSVILDSGSAVITARVADLATIDFDKKIVSIQFSR